MITLFVLAIFKIIYMNTWQNYGISMHIVHTFEVNRNSETKYPLSFA